MFISQPASSFGNKQLLPLKLQWERKSTHKRSLISGGESTHCIKALNLAPFIDVSLAGAYKKHLKSPPPRKTMPLKGNRRGVEPEGF